MTDGIILLENQRYDKREFADLNDPEFTELISPIEGLSINDFFTLYESFKEQIPPGDADLDIIIDTDQAESTLLALQRVVENLRAALSDASGFQPELFREHVDRARETYTTVLSRISKLSDLFVNVESGTHAYLVANSLPMIERINKKFKDIFDYMIVLLDQNADLTEENAMFKAEIDDLKKQVARLNDVILKLTRPISGFQVIPDLFSYKSDPLFKAGRTVELIVCGSANYAFQAGTGFEDSFKFIYLQENDPTQNVVYVQTHERLEGQTAYITAYDGIHRDDINKPDVDFSQAVASEQIVFVFAPKPGPPPPPGTDTLISSAPYTVNLYIPEVDVRGEDLENWYKIYKTSMIITISGGTSPYTYKTYFGSGPAYFDVDWEFDDRPEPNKIKFMVIAKQAGGIPDSLVITDATGKTVKHYIRVEKVDIVKPPTSVKVSPENSFISVEGTTTLTVSGGGGVRKIAWDGASIYNDGARAFIVTRPGPISGAEEQITFTAKPGFTGTFNGKITDTVDTGVATFTIKVGMGDRLE